jgi:type IV secretory pathway VirB9-like protein
MKYGSKTNFVRYGVVAVLSFIAIGAQPMRAESEGGRTVKYSQKDIVQIRARIRFSTLIVLPQNEDILDFATGDKDFWIINGVHNLCYVHPAQSGIKTDLHLITSSGHVYSFLLTEVGNSPNAEPDLKVFIEPADQSSVASRTGSEGYVRAGEVEAYKKEIESLRSQTADQVRAAQVQSVEQINKFRSEYAGRLHFDYEVDAKAAKEPFLLSAIYHDDTFTYIQCAAQEKPALYELKDGKPNLINFQVENGVYVVPKIIESGYLAVGKKKISFTKHASRASQE